MMQFAGQFPKGQWSIRVRDRRGNPLADAHLTLATEEGQPLSCGSDYRGPFDNYTVPGSVHADSDGVLWLHNTRDVKYGGDDWELFWTWPMGRDDVPECLRLHVTAPGYEAATASVEDLFAQKNMTLTLGKKE